MSISIYYLQLLPDIREAAKACGFAIGLHGSMTKDFDLIAAPWTADAKSPEELIEAIRVAVDGKIIPTGTKGGRWSKELNQFVDAIIENPQKKPCGRLAWNIQLGAGAVLDVSVMPKSVPELPAGKNPGRFRHKTADVDIVCWDGKADTANDFFGEGYGTDWEYVTERGTEVFFKGPNGRCGTARVGDWLVRYDNGEVRAVPTETFQLYYEPVGALEG